MNWFEDLTGFPEPDHATVRERLAVDGHDLLVLGSGRRYGIGELELVSLRELRERAVQPGVGSGRARVRIVKGEVRQMHRQPQYAGALFQVASQFNLLEMVSPEVTPEDGVTRYQHDGTQGPSMQDWARCTCSFIVAQSGRFATFPRGPSHPSTSIAHSRSSARSATV